MKMQVWMLKKQWCLVIYINAARIYYKFHHGHYDNTNQFSTNQEPNADAMAFLNLLVHKKQPLYVGCDNISLMQATTILLHIKSQRNVTSLSYEDFLTAFKS